MFRLWLLLVQTKTLLLVLFWHFPKKAKGKKSPKLEDELVFCIYRLQTPQMYLASPRVGNHRFRKMSTMVCSNAIILLCSPCESRPCTLSCDTAAHCMRTRPQGRMINKYLYWIRPLHTCADRDWESSHWNQPRLFTSKPKLKEDAVNV